ncbi:MAG: FlgD immunoglobulin-like domain containing protein [Candidatus Latescibacterota bacterium]|jgi:hypothetical protein
MTQSRCSRTGIAPARFPNGLAIGWLLGLLLATGGLQQAGAVVWRVGDQSQPWQPFPVSQIMSEGPEYRKDYTWGGGFAVEVVVDDDGDGLIDEDPVEVIDNDGDGQHNEDPEDGLDNDHDGLVDEDPVEPQVDNDGDGLVNEDGLRTGGPIYDPDIRQSYTLVPFFRYATAAEAAANPTKAGWGWGDDDHDNRWNEDPTDGLDNDTDGLIDEDGATPSVSLPSSWSLPVVAYDTTDLSLEQRRALGFTWDTAARTYVATAPGGGIVTARIESRTFTPRDYIRSIRLDPMRNIVRLLDDRFLSGLLGIRDPMDSTGYGSTLVGSAHSGDGGHGQIADGNIFTAKGTSSATASSGFRAELKALFYVDMLRLRPRPDFPDRTPPTFQITYAGDKPTHFQELYTLGELQKRLVVTEYIIPYQTDQLRPPVKEYRFDGGKLGDPKKVRVLDFRSGTPEGYTWELAEFEAYGHGSAQDAAYITEIIDVGTTRPQFRRYYDSQDPTRPIAFETVQTLDLNKNSKIDPEELASTKLRPQFDPDAAGTPVTWGRLRWSGQQEGNDGDVLVRVRAGTSPDTYVYQRKVGRGVLSPYIDRSRVADWPAAGSRVDAYSYASLSGLDQPNAGTLPYNYLGDADGSKGGWTVWSAPMNWNDGLVDQNGNGGVLLPLPPLTRYIQLWFEFKCTETSGVSIDWVEFDYSLPVVSRGVVAEIYPDSTGELGRLSPFRYVMKPDIANSDIGFNRIDLIVPSTDAQIDTLLVDDLSWTRLIPRPPAGSSSADSAAYVGRLLRSQAWLDTVRVTADRIYASASYVDSATGQARLSVKTRTFKAVDFPQGQDKDIQIVMQAPVYRLLTEFSSYVWNDVAAGYLQQPTSPGNAADHLPSDDVKVTVAQVGKSVALRTVSPNPFTPNGDGINDQTRFEFDLFLLTAAVNVEVIVFDLTGRPLRHLVSLASGAGVRDLSWDGYDDDGNLVPPGIYLYRLSAESDTQESKATMGTVAVAY